MINKASQFRVAWPMIELATYRVAGRHLTLYSNSGLLNARASQEPDIALTPNLRILRRLELDWLKLWWTRLEDRLHISLRDAYYLEMRVRWFDSFGQKSLAKDIQQAPGRTWNPTPHLVLRTGCEQACIHLHLHIGIYTYIHIHINNWYIYIYIHVYSYLWCPI